MKSLYKKLAAYGLGGAVALSGAYLVAPWEGKENKAYVDPVGILTSCYGHTGPELKKGQVFTDEQCLNQLAEDLVKHDKQMMRYIRVPLTDKEHAAYLSFTYNLGVGAFSKSTLLKKLNQKEFEAACKELDKWVYAGGKKLNGLVKRRAAEREMCLEGVKERGLINEDHK
jgi:lysozyme